MYKATNLAIHRTGFPVKNKECLVGGAYHISTEYTTLYYRSVWVTPLGEVWWCCLSHASYHFHFACNERTRQSFRSIHEAEVKLHKTRVLRMNLDKNVKSRQHN